MKRQVFAMAITAIATFAWPSMASAPLLDGDCSDYPAAFATLSRGVTVHKAEDPGSVWLCFDLPDDTLPAVEFVLTSPGLDAPLTIHASAQLGEWPARNPEAAPKDSASDLWWNNRDWTALPVRFHGLAPSPAPPQADFKTSSGQELQFRKERFGCGVWTVEGQFFEVGVAIKGPADGPLTFPTCTNETDAGG